MSQEADIRDVLETVADKMPLAEECRDLIASAISACLLTDLGSDIEREEEWWGEKAVRAYHHLFPPDDEE